MSETATATPQEQSKTEAPMSGFDRLSQDPRFIFEDNKPEVKSETKPPVTATEETEKLENPEVTNPESKAPETVETKEPPAAEEKAEAKSEEVGFEDAPATAGAEEGSWKSLIESFGYTIPEDFTEEKGQEIFAALKEEELVAARREAQNYRELEIFSELPETVQGEAKLWFELLKSGQTFEQINAPTEQIKAWKSMSKEQLIRANLEGIEGYTTEMIDHRMEQIIANNHVDVEYNILMNSINQLEQRINTERQNLIQTYTAQQNQIREQKRQQEINLFKTALDKVPTFMDKKLTVENKANILNDYTNGYVQNLLKNPEKVAKFMLYDRYGEQGINYLQSRAIEQATLERAKQLHNVPPTTTGGANRVESTTSHKSGLDRLASDPRFS